MSEIADAFRRIERPNVRTNTSVQPFNCALRSFAQACFQRMKQQLYWVKVRRIFRQVAQACTDSLDRRFHTPNLVEGDIVDHHNVPPLECWDQTLLYVSQEGLAIHGSFDQHRRHNASLTQASDKRHRLPVAHRCIADQALATRIPTVEPHHVGGHCCFIDKYEVGRVNKASLANPASACTRHVGSLALRRPQTFFDGDAMTGEEAGQWATTSLGSLLVKRRNNLIEPTI